MKAARAWKAYREILLWYAGNAVINFAAAQGVGGAELAARLCAPARVRDWENLGGQLAPLASVDALLSRAARGGFGTWDDMHAEYARLAEAYPLEKARHAWAVLAWLAGKPALCPSDLETALGDLARLSERVEEAVYCSRKKDYDNPFRRATVRSEAEAAAVLGSAECDPFVLKTRKDCVALRERIAEIGAKG